MSPRSRKIVGLLLIGLALVAFLTVADDLRHTGELFSALGLLASGVALFVAGQYPSVTSTLALNWVPFGIAAGALGGLVIDEVATGVSLGTVAGLLLARVRRFRRV